MGMMTLLFIVQFLMGISILVAASRQAWAFSRDGALPFSSFFRPISVKFGYIPLRTVWGCVAGALLLGLLTLIAPAAAQAVFSLAVAGNNLAWLIPILARVVWGQAKFKPGPFYTGRFSLPIAWTAIVFLIFGIILAMFPVGGPNPTRKFRQTFPPLILMRFSADVMNYTVVINSAVWLGALAYYFIDARKWFMGPKITVDTEDMTEEQKQALADDGLDLRGLQGVRSSGSGEGSGSATGSDVIKG